MKDYKERTRELREDNDKTQSEVAKVLGIRQNVYSRYENGKNEMSINFIIKLAEFYNVSTDYILGLTNDSKQHPRA